MTTDKRILLNRLAAPTVAVAAPAAAAGAPRDFHRRLPGYEPTPLVPAPAVARRLGVGSVWVKVEASRFGLPAFKILGASWAVWRALEQKAGPFRPWRSLAELGEQVRAKAGPLAFTAATDGNHGRAVARVASLLGLTSHIFVPAGTARARIEAIEGEGARVTVVDGTYDDAVARAAAEAGERCLLIQDTDPTGDDPVPGWVMEGYGTIFQEVDEQLAERGAADPDLVAVQIGVGALAGAAVAHFRHPERPRRARMVGVEPLDAACALVSFEQGQPTLVAGPHRSVMAGLNCGFPSLAAWPALSRGIDAFVAVGDGYVPEAVRLLAGEGIEAGETGAAGLVGLLALTDPDDPAAAEAREWLEWHEVGSVLLICTEGVTDPESYRAMMAAGSRDA